MLSLQRSSEHHPTLIPPWFAQPQVSNTTGQQFWIRKSPNDPITVIPASTYSSDRSSSGSTSIPAASPTTTATTTECHKSFYPNQCEVAKASLKATRTTLKTINNCDELNLPSDPRSWLREDVQTWIRYMADIHGLPRIDSERFLMNGKALCLMTMDMFCQRVPLGGKMLYKDFQLRLSMAMYNTSC